MSGRHAVAVALAALALVLGAPGPAAAQTAVPSATLNRSNVSIGDRVLVQGENWPARTIVHIELCGNSAANLSADCDLAGASDAGVGENGYFSMALAIRRPPSDCPCVVRVTDPSAQGQAMVPITIAGVPNNGQGTAPLPDISTMLKVSQVRVRGTFSLAAWFGGASKRTLEFTVANVSSEALRDPPLSITFGKGDNPTGFVAAPHLGDLAPGDLRLVRVPVEIDSLSMGRYTVKGQISGPGQPIVFRTRTSTYPWGLFVIGLIVLQLILLGLRNRLRRHLYGERVDADEKDDVDGVAASTDEEAAAVREPSVATAPQETAAALPAVDPVPPPVPDAMGERVADLARSLQLTTDELLAAVAQRADAMARAREAMDQRATEAIGRLVADAHTHRGVISERRNLARHDLDRAQGHALEILDIAEGKAKKLVSDAERLARMLVERAHADASALLLPATPEALDGVVPEPSPDVDLVELSGESSETDTNTR